MKTMIEIKNLHYDYGFGDVLHGVDFNICEGESVAIVGANGAGKSTLLLHLNGFFLPSKGEVVIDSVAVSKASLKKIRQKVGMLFPVSDDQLFMPTVYDDVAFGPKNLGLKGAELKSAVQGALKRAGVEHLSDRPVHELSTGEKKSAAFAGVLAMEPDVLVMDEPSAGLDPRSRRSMINLLNSFEQTKVIATHDLDMVCDVCQRVIVMNEGIVEADGVPSEVFQDEDFLYRCGLEKPACLL